MADHSLGSPDAALRLASTQTSAASLSPSALGAGDSWLQRFGHWLSEGFDHAFGNPREESAHLPPLVGVQPYRDRPTRRRRR